MTDDGYDTFKEAFDSGYSAAIHNDLPTYLARQKPWWCPKWVWLRAVRRALVQAVLLRGDDQ